MDAKFIVAAAMLGSLAGIAALAALDASQYRATQEARYAAIAREHAETAAIMTHYGQVAAASQDAARDVSTAYNDPKEVELRRLQREDERALTALPRAPVECRNFVQIAGGPKRCL